MLSSAKRDPTKLTNTEERAMLDEIRKRAYKHCDPVVKPWAECTAQSGLAAAFRCRPLLRRMEECLHAYDVDGAKEEITKEYIYLRAHPKPSEKLLEQERKRDEMIRKLVQDEKERRARAKEQAQKEHASK